MKETYLSIRCVVQSDLEEELPELLAPWGVLGTEIGDGSDVGVSVTVFLPGVDLDGADSLCRLLVEKGAGDIRRR
jgi:hypothetical protein